MRGISTEKDEKQVRRMELTEKDLHCLARILQDCEYADGDMFQCCQFCLHQQQCNELAKKGRTYYTETVRKKLQDITGVYLGIDACNIKEKLLRNSFHTTSKHVNRQ